MPIESCFYSEESAQSDSGINGRGLVPKNVPMATQPPHTFFGTTVLFKQKETKTMNKTALEVFDDINEKSEIFIKTTEKNYDKTKYDENYVTNDAENDKIYSFTTKIKNRKKELKASRKIIEKFPLYERIKEFNSKLQEDTICL